MEKTLIQFFEKCVEKFNSQPFLMDNKSGEYISFSYNDVQHLVYNCAGALLKFGIKKGDRLAILSEGRSQWLISELGILYAGAINVPLSVKLEEESDLLFRLKL